MELKKLLSLGAVASASLIGTSLVTSCSSNPSSFTYDLMNFNDWKPSINKRGGELSDVDAGKTYLSEVKKNYKILAEDYISTWGAIFAPSGRYESISINITEIDTESCLLSISIESIGTFMDANKHTTSKTEFKNMRMNVRYNVYDNESSWNVYCDMDDDYFKTDTKWEVKTLATNDGEDKPIQDTTWNKSSIDADPTMLDLIKASLLALQWASYYLSDTILN